MSLFNELKRRNVFRVAAAYLVIGWLLLQVADTVLPALHLPDWIISALTLLLILGFIPTVLFSWAYELTPEGLKKDSEVSANDLASTHTAKKLDVITLIAVVAVTALIAWQQFTTQPAVKAQSDAVINQVAAVGVEQNPDQQQSSGYSSIAVLPFVDLSPLSDQAYFSDGIAEEILNVLVKVKALKVASRTSSFGFKGQESQGIPKIAEQLNVRHILEGSVRKSGATVRVTAQLIDAQTDLHLWSETYDRELTTENLFAIQDEVATAIVKQLGIALNTESAVINGSKHLLDLDNYELFLKARALYRSRTELDTADAYLAQIVEKDADFAPAWELRAALPVLLVEYGFADWGYDTVQQKADQFADRALALNPNSALALAAKANSRSWGAKQELVAQDFNQIILDFKRAIEIDPSLPSPMNWLGMAYAVTGQLDLAIQSFELCQQNHPFFAPCVENLYDIQVSAGQYDVAWQLFTQAIEQGISTGTWVNFRLLALRKERTAFLLGAGSKRLLIGWHRIAEVYEAYQNLDQDHSALLADLSAYVATQPNFDWVYASNLLMPLGAFHLKPFEPAMWGREYSQYRQSEPFKKYIIGTGVLRYWQQHGFPPQCRAIGAEDFVCD